MEVSLTPLKLTKEQEIEFCQSRILQQLEYMVEILITKRLKEKKRELYNQAKEIKTAFENKLKELQC